MRGRKLTTARPNNIEPANSDCTSIRIEARVSPTEEAEIEKLNKMKKLCKQLSFDDLINHPQRLLQTIGEPGTAFRLVQEYAVYILLYRCLGGRVLANLTIGQFTTFVAAANSGPYISGMFYNGALSTGVPGEMTYSSILTPGSLTVPHIVTPTISACE